MARPVDESHSSTDSTEKPTHHNASHDTDMNAGLPSHHEPHEKADGSPKKFSTKIHPDGESGRRGFHIYHFIHVVIISSNTVSSWLNVLWPVVPAAIAVHFALPERHLVIFILNYIAMIPCANCIGFAGQELARKIPKVFGILIETSLGSLVEIILFVVLIVKGNQNVPVIRSAILGSILANMLLCMGLCFIAGGIRHSSQTFHDAISEVGSGLLLVAGMGLVAPAAFSSLAITSSNSSSELTNPDTQSRILHISRATAVILLVAYIIYVIFSMTSHHNLMSEVLENDEQLDHDRERDLAKKKLTFTEAIIALVISLACVALIAEFLVHEIEYIVRDHGVSESFMGLILVPLVEKVAEHATAVDEAWDNQANFALAHILGASIQTALLNTPLVVFVGWGLGRQMDLDFASFDAIVLVLAILVVGNFLRDGKSNYLEGSLCVLVYVIVAICAFYYPNPAEEGDTATGPENGGQELRRLRALVAAAGLG